MAASTSSQPSPSDQVFTLLDVLEPILLHVNDMQTLLLSQRVNKFFRAAIHSSLKLRRILWLEPTPPADQPADFPKINPLLAKHHMAINILTLATAIDAQNRNDILGRYHYLEVRVIAKNDESSWMRMLPFQPKEPIKWALACPFTCETSEDREQPRKWVSRDEDDELWLDPEDCEEYVGRGVFITKCTKLGKVAGTMTIREMFEAAGEEGLRERVQEEELRERIAEMEVEEDEEEDGD